MTTITCHATNRRGERCHQAVVPGASVCFYHGGGAPQVRAAAAERQALARAQRLADLLHVEPLRDGQDVVDALLDTASQAKALVDALRHAVAELETVSATGVFGAETVKAEVAAYLTALGRAESLLTGILKLDLEARKVKLNEQNVQLLEGAFEVATNRAQVDADAAVRLRREFARSVRDTCTAHRPEPDPVADPVAIPDPVVPVPALPEVTEEVPF